MLPNGSTANPSVGALGVAKDYEVFSRRILTGTISDLPCAARWAWVAIMFDVDLLSGRVKVPVRDLAKMATISIEEAADALRRFQEPDPFSSSKELDGKRLIPIEGEEDWYQVVTWDKHKREREAFFNRLRQNRWAKERKEELTEPNADQSNLTKDIEVEEQKQKKEQQESSLFGGTSSKKEKKTARELVEGFALTPKHRSWAKVKTPHVDADEVFEDWQDAMKSNGYKTKNGPVLDPEASWRTWMRRREGWWKDKHPTAPSAHPPIHRFQDESKE
jgi:hypothetical protein